MGEPLTVVAAAWRGPVLALGIGGGVTLLLGSALALLAARAVLGPARRLGHHAQVLAAGDIGARAAAIPPAPVREFEVLRRGFAAAVAEGTPPVLADAAQLEAVMVNLANNARDALPGGAGRIVLCAGEVEATASGAPSGVAPGAYVILSVIDDGEGMPPEVLARATEPFFTTKPRGKGTGLGLAMARGFAELSGGALVIRTAPGQGTTVTLWMPRASAAAIRTPYRAERADGPDVQDSFALNILLVDDEPDVRATVAAGLADRGHAVVEASDSASALAQLDRGVAIDALVTDLSMPGGMDGLALVREARLRCPGLPALLITGHAGEAGRNALQEAVGTGPFAVVGKPASPETVATQIVSLFLGGRASRPTASATG